MKLTSALLAIGSENGKVSEAEMELLIPKRTHIQDIDHIINKVKKKAGYSALKPLSVKLDKLSGKFELL